MSSYEQYLICPLEWDASCLRNEFESHLIADSLGFVRRTDDLCECIHDGLHYWEDAYDGEGSSLAYPDWVKKSAISIFYGLTSAEQHNDGNLANSMRRVCSTPTRIDPKITDAELYAMAAAVNAWRSLQSIRHFIDGVLDALRKDYAATLDGQSCDVFLARFKQYDDRGFYREANKYAGSCRGMIDNNSQLSIAEAKLLLVKARTAIAEAESTRRRAADNAGVSMMNGAKQATDDFKDELKSAAIDLIEKSKATYLRGNKPNMKQLATKLVVDFRTYPTRSGETRETSLETLRTDWLPKLLQDYCSSR